MIKYILILLFIFTLLSCNYQKSELQYNKDIIDENISNTWFINSWWWVDF